MALSLNAIGCGAVAADDDLARYEADDFSMAPANPLASDLIDRLKANDPSLTTLNLRDSLLTHAEVIAIAEGLRVNRTLTTLSLSHCYSLGDTGAAAIADALAGNATLTTLNLYWINFGAAGATAIANAMKANHTLTTLNIGWNHLGQNQLNSAGAAAIAAALKVNRTLQKLNVQCTGISAADGAVIADAMKVNNTLTTLDREYNDFGAAEEAAIASALARNRVWSRERHGAFPQSCHTNVICALLAAARFHPKLPTEVWTDEILPNLRRSDFR